MVEKAAWKVLEDGRDTRRLLAQCWKSESPITIHTKRDQSVQQLSFDRLQREMPRLELMLGKWESANEIPPGTSSHAVWGESMSIDEIP